MADTDLYIQTSQTNRLALGTSWRPQSACNSTAILQWPPQSHCDDSAALAAAAADLSLARLLTYANSSDADINVRLISTLLLQQKGGKGGGKARLLFSIPSLIADLVSDLRITGQTSYVAASPGASQAAGVQHNLQ